MTSTQLSGSTIGYRWNSVGVEIPCAISKCTWLHHDLGGKGEDKHTKAQLFNLVLVHGFAHFHALQLYALKQMQGQARDQRYIV